MTALPANSTFMPSTSFELAPAPLIRLQLWLYRIGGYLLINFVDDPVWLALMFC